MTTDGGQVAITGFKLQVLVALLDSFPTSDWESFSIEPLGVDDVDVIWKYHGGVEDHVQVKHSVNPFTPGVIRAHVRSMLRRRRTPRRRTLVLVGTGRSVTVDGVEVLVRVNDEDALLSDAASKAHRWLECHTSAPRHQVVRDRTLRIAKELLWDAGKGREWSRQAFVAMVWSELTAPVRERPTSIAPLELEVRRTVVIEGDGGGHDYIRCTLVNPTSEHVTLDSFHVVLTDARSVSVVKVGYGDATPGWDYGRDDRGDFAVWFHWWVLRVEPNSRRTYVVDLRRSRVASFLDGVWRFGDPFTPTQQIASARVEVVFPDTGRIVAPTCRSATPRTATWLLSTAPDVREVDAQLYVDPSAAEDPQVAAIMQGVAADFVAALPHHSLDGG